jgi:serine/threonine-protein kinase
MAEVFLAKVTGRNGFEKPVAIKRVHPSHARGDRRPSLMDEAKLSVELSHPNIVQTFDVGRAEGADFIVMEHIEGYDAQHVLDSLRLEEGVLPIDLAAYIVAEVCRGLHHAHQHRDARGEPAGIVHRDVSPQNILLSFAGEVKLADFGIAKTNERRTDPETRVIKGKYFYMSPEQSRAEALDHRSDVFSSGVVLWELLTGRRLHDAPDVRSLLAAVRRADVPPPSSVRPGVPAELDAVVARSTAACAEDRFDDARSMADALERYLRSRAPTRAVERIGMLLAELPEPCVVTIPPPEPPVPRTRDAVETVSAVGRATPTEPPLRYDLDDGQPTLVGWRAPISPEPHLGWRWIMAAGALLVGFVAWWLRGA